MCAADIRTHPADRSTKIECLSSPHSAMSYASRERRWHTYTHKTDCALLMSARLWFGFELKMPFAILSGWQIYFASSRLTLFARPFFDKPIFRAASAVALAMSSWSRHDELADGGFDGWFGGGAGCAVWYAWWTRDVGYIGNVSYVYCIW